MSKIIHIDKDELFPWYIAFEEHSSINTCELTDEEWKDYNRVDEEFHDWQDRLELLYKQCK